MFITLKDKQGHDVRVNVDQIVFYETMGPNPKESNLNSFISLAGGRFSWLEVEQTVEEIDKLIGKYGE